MKKIAILLLCVLPCAAMARTNVQKLLSSAQRLQKEGLYLEAMDSATLALRIDEDNRNAKDFVYRNWDNLIRQTDSYLGQFNDMESLEHAAARCETYRLLEEIYNNLREVRMPLYGPNQSWVWQPEIAYYTGHYDEERFRAFRLAVQKTEEALRSYDTFTAETYIGQALNQFLITDNERETNRKEIVERCRQVLSEMSQSQQIHQVIFAYDLCGLLLHLDSTQTDIEEEQTKIRQQIAALYTAQALAAEQAGDTIRAVELRLSAEDWQ